MSKKRMNISTKLVDTQSDAQIKEQLKEARASLSKLIEDAPETFAGPSSSDIPHPSDILGIFDHIHIYEPPNHGTPFSKVFSTARLANFQDVSELVMNVLEQAESKGVIFEYKDMPKRVMFPLRLDGRPIGKITILDNPKPVIRIAYTYDDFSIWSILSQEITLKILATIDAVYGVDLQGTNKHPPRKLETCRDLPETDKTLKKWKKSYLIIQKTKQQYQERYDDGDTENPEPTVNDIIEALKYEGIKYSGRHIQNIVNAGNAGCLDD